jgi:hypothetical protein
MIEYAQEAIMWKAVQVEMPKDGKIVLTYSPQMAEPVWMGWADGLDWRQLSGEIMPGVTHWAELPNPPDHAWEKYQR